MGNTCVGTGCCNPKSNGSSARKPLDKPFTDPSPGESFLCVLSSTFFFESSGYLILLGLFMQLLIHFPTFPACF